MEYTAREIANLIGAVITGDPGAKVNRLSKIEEGTPGSLCFLGNLKYESHLYTTGASIVIVDKSFTPSHPVAATLLSVDDARAAFAMLLEAYEGSRQEKTGISELAYVAATAIIGKNTYIGPFSYIGDGVTIGDHVKVYPQVFIGEKSVIGEGTLVYPGVRIYRDTVIGRNCIFHSGVVIGSDGFGYAPDKGNVYHKIPQTGNVVIEDDVEIGSNSTIDRATLGSTKIGKGCKIDNLVQVAHNVELGENTILVSQSGVAGSTKIGKNVQVGGQVGIVGHLTIADGVRIAGQSGVEGSIKEPGTVVMGSPAFNIRHFQRSYIYFRKLEELVRRLDELEKKNKEK